MEKDEFWEILGDFFLFIYNIWRLGDCFLENAVI